MRGTVATKKGYISLYYSVPRECRIASVSEDCKDSKLSSCRRRQGGERRHLSRLEKLFQALLRIMPNPKVSMYTHIHIYIQMCVCVCILQLFAAIIRRDILVLWREEVNSRSATDRSISSPRTNGCKRLTDPPWEKRTQCRSCNSRLVKSAQLFDRKRERRGSSRVTWARYLLYVLVRET